MTVKIDNALFFNPLPGQSFWFFCPAWCVEGLPRASMYPCDPLQPCVGNNVSSSRRYAVFFHQNRQRLQGVAWVQM